MNNPTSQSLPRVLSLDLVAELLGCNRRTVQREIERGKLKAFKAGSLIRVRLEEFERYTQEPIKPTS